MRVLYRTFGCKANQYDTERMREELEARGLGTTESSHEAGVCVVNTCTVTNQADADARRFIRRLRREHPRVSVVVAGCSSALKPDAYHGMEGVVGVVEGHDPVEVARAALDSPPVQLQMTRPLDRIHTEPVAGELLSRRAGGTRGWLKIQDGCDRRCSFCATRLARGRSRSRHAAEVVEEARLMAGTHPELVLTGIHIGHYGRDLEDSRSLSELVALLLEEVPEVRFRLGSVEATEVDDLLLDLLRSSGGALAPHLHMPMQSGSDAVLRSMRRWHTRAMYRERAREIVERFPVLGLGADIITGFPGESEEDHAQTRALVDELPFTYLHVFPFSPRDGTPAVELGDPVPQRVAGERSKELRELGIEKGRRYREGRVGEEARVVVEGDGEWALTGDYLRVRVEGEPPDHPGPFTARLRGTGEHPYIDSPRDSESISWGRGSNPGRNRAGPGRTGQNRAETPAASR